jgi:hypothetical protein
VAQIRSLQSLYPTSAKKSPTSCLPPLVRGKAREATVGVHTLGRIIARAPRTRCAPRPEAHRYPRAGARLKPCAVSPQAARKPKAVTTASHGGQCLAVDTIERIRDGIRRYILTFIDPASRALAVALQSKASRHTPRGHLPPP